MGTLLIRTFPAIPPCSDCVLRQCAPVHRALVTHRPLMLLTARFRGQMMRAEAR